MATIGSVLNAPESGWRRYDQKDSRILFSNGTWNTDNANSPAYNGSQATSNSLGATCTFKFKGSKIRLIGTKDSSFSNNIEIYIDNVLETIISENYTSNVFQILLFEKTGLANTTHTIKFVNKTTNYIVIDAIDIDSTGYLVHPTLNQVSDINSMQVGDCIPCRYTATSGVAGYFSELGTCITNEIPIAGTATPDGLFYLIKTDKGILIADRVIQTNISWDVLNAAGLIEGAINPFKSQVPYLTANTSGTITVSASSVHSGTYAYQAFDSIASDYWYSDQTTNAWIEVDFGEQKLIKVIKLQTYANLGYQFKNFKIEGSNDHNAWNSLFTGVGPNIALAWVTCKLNITQSYRYYRVTILDTFGDVAIIQKIKLFTEDPMVIRSLSAGVAYIDASGNLSLTDKSLGAWPPNNEWDKYIVNSDFKGKITKGDDNIWHWNNNKASWTKDTPMNGMNRGDGWLGQNDRRIHNKLTTTGEIKGRSYSTSNYVGVEIGFRPVLNYVESDIASEVIY